MPEKKLILVIGATGAQGLPVVASLLAPGKDSSPSPYAVRALTRDAKHERALHLQASGVELFEGVSLPYPMRISLKVQVVVALGSFENTSDIISAYKGCYGAFVNTDTFTIGQKREIYAALQLYEYARREPGMQHFVWSGLDYASKLGKYDLKYKTEHLDGKGIFGDFLKSQDSESAPDGEGLTWSIVTTGPYIEGLRSVLLGPRMERENGAVVFDVPLGDGHVPVISLRDIGWWARYTFDHRSESSGKELKIATEMLTGDGLAETFTRVTGIPAIYERLGVDEYFGQSEIEGLDKPYGGGESPSSIRDTFSGMYWTWRDDLIERDMEWIRRVYPEGYTLESWIRETGYDGTTGTVEFKSNRGLVRK
ncbi:hypothetical protein V5O48_014509 [Marasmius crinis-equi]|uniref:NmrA-like domain-containing protein n=1 Tax=Marasmius crinis-equi TaxID=585013 RepID=A0ABR3EX38_9AGAR